MPGIEVPLSAFWRISTQGCYFYRNLLNERELQVVVRFICDFAWIYISVLLRHQTRSKSVGFHWLENYVHNSVLFYCFLFYRTVFGTKPWKRDILLEAKLRSDCIILFEMKKKLKEETSVFSFYWPRFFSFSSQSVNCSPNFYMWVCSSEFCKCYYKQKNFFYRRNSGQFQDSFLILVTMHFALLNIS